MIRESVYSVDPTRISLMINLSDDYDTIAFVVGEEVIRIYSNDLIELLNKEQEK